MTALVVVDDVGYDKGHRQLPLRERTMTTITAEQVERIGGKRWTKRDGTVRIYLNNWHDMAGLEIGRYNTGNINVADLLGKRLSNRVGGQLAAAKVWWENDAIHTTLDTADNRRAASRFDVDMDEVLAKLRTAIADRVAAVAV